MGLINWCTTRVILHCHLIVTLRFTVMAQSTEFLSPRRWSLNLTEPDLGLDLSRLGQACWAGGWLRVSHGYLLHSASHIFRVPVPSAKWGVHINATYAIYRLMHILHIKSAYFCIFSLHFFLHILLIQSI